MIFAMSDEHEGKCFTSWLGRSSDVSLLGAGVCPLPPEAPEIFTRYIQTFGFYEIMK